MPKTIPQKRRLPPKEGYNIITVKNSKGDEVRQRYVKTKGFVDAVRDVVTDKTDSGDATGEGGRRRERKVMDEVDKAVEGAS